MFMALIACTEPAWEVRVYMAADNNLERAALENLGEIETDSRIRVQLDRAEGYVQGDDNWTGVRRYGTDIVSFGELDSASASVLAEFLSEGEIPKRPRDKYSLLVLWGHGRAGDGLLFDEDSGRWMTYNALRGALEGHHYDVIALDACTILTLDMLATVYQAADYVVGVSTTRHALGFHYRELLATRNFLNPRGMARWLVADLGSRGEPVAGAAIESAKVGSLLDAWQDVLSAATAAGRDPGAVDRLPRLAAGVETVDLRAAAQILGAGAGFFDVLAEATTSVSTSAEWSSVSGVGVEVRPIMDALGVDHRALREASRPCRSRREADGRFVHVGHCGQSD